MFAASGQSNIFHFTEVRDRTTVCGLRVSRVVREKGFGSRLHLITTKPADGRVCKNCLRISEGDK
jgi:hypothetical protein